MLASVLAAEMVRVLNLEYDVEPIYAVSARRIRRCRAGKAVRHCFCFLETRRGVLISESMYPYWWFISFGFLDALSCLSVDKYTSHTRGANYEGGNSQMMKTSRNHCPVADRSELLRSQVIDSTNNIPQHESSHDKATLKCCE